MSKSKAKFKIQFIFTFEKSEQVITRFNPIPSSFLTDKNNFLAFAMLQLNREEQAELIKISSCIQCDNVNDLPSWFVKCNGKFWLDDLEPFKSSIGVVSTVSHNFIEDWYKENL